MLWRGCKILSLPLCFQDESERLWLAGLIEESVHWTLEADRQAHLAKLLLRSQVSTIAGQVARNQS